MKFRHRSIAWAAVLALSATPLLAQGHDEHGMGSMGGMGGMMDGGMMGDMDMAAMMRVHAYDPAQLLEKQADLALTASQVSQLRALVLDVATAKEKAKADHDAHHAQVEALFQQDVPDAAQVRAHAQAAMTAMAGGHVAEMEGFAKAKGLLSAKQRGLVDQWASEHQKMMKEHQGAGHD